MNARFMESEIELNDIIQEMHVIGTRHEFYPILLQSHAIELLLSLLSHENSGWLFNFILEKVLNQNGLN